MELANEIREDIRDFKAKNNCDRLVMVWAASTEIFIEEQARPPQPRGLRGRRWRRTTRSIAPSMLYAYAAMMEDVPFANGAPNLTVDIPAIVKLAHGPRRAGLRQGLQDRPDAAQDGPRADVQGAHARHQRLVLDEHPRQPRRRGPGRPGELQDEGRVEARRPRVHPPAGPLPRALRRHLPQGAHQLLPAPRRQQRGLGQHRHLRLARLPDADQGRLPLPRLHPRRAAGPRPRAVHGPRASARA